MEAGFDSALSGALHLSTVRGLTGALRTMLSLGASPNLTSAELGGRTLLMEAISHRQMKSVEVLVEFGAEVGQRDHRGSHALLQLLSCSDYANKCFREKCLRFLLPHMNANPADGNCAEELDLLLEISLVAALSRGLWEDALSRGLWEDALSRGLWEDALSRGLWEDALSPGLWEDARLLIRHGASLQRVLQNHSWVFQHVVSNSSAFVVNQITKVRWGEEDDDDEQGRVVLPEEVVEACTKLWTARVERRLIDRKRLNEKVASCLGALRKQTHAQKNAASRCLSLSFAWYRCTGFCTAKSKSVGESDRTDSRFHECEEGFLPTGVPCDLSHVLEKARDLKFDSLESVFTELDGVVYAVSRTVWGFHPAVLRSGTLRKQISAQGGPFAAAEESGKSVRRCTEEIRRAHVQDVRWCVERVKKQLMESFPNDGETDSQ